MVLKYNNRFPADGQGQETANASICACRQAVWVCLPVCVCAHTPEDDSKVNNSCKLSLQVSLTIYDEIKQYEILLILAGKRDVGSI